MKKTVKDEDYYYKLREKIYNQLAQLPRGTIKKRLISGHAYYYLQRRRDKKVVHQYIGKEIPPELKQQMQKREALKRELAKIQDVTMGFLTAKIRGL
jgi:ABC-type phosphate transport system auxiliary subunit